MTHYSPNSNPWPGLSSYEDPKNSKKSLRFCGRDSDILELDRLINDNLLVVLYGRSGIGKTSLLNAGVFPLLRASQYLPISIRLGTFEESTTYQSTIISSLEKAINEIHGKIKTINVIEEQSDITAPDYLWNYFARHHFTNANNQTLFPVIVLDQFEEVLRDSDIQKQQMANAFLIQIQYLTDESHSIRDCMVDDTPYYYDLNFRFVISIREDDLYLLEDSIYSLSLNIFKRCRYRLRNLSEQQATEAILTPGRECIEESEKDKIVRRIIHLAKPNELGPIDTLLLSLICSGTFDRKTGTKITESDLKVWKNDPMRVYYMEAIFNLENSQIQFIQKHLIKRDGSRVRVPVSDLKNAVGESGFSILTKGVHKLLNLLPNGQAELLHDQLASVIFEDREAFEERERNWKYQEMQSRFVAEKAKALAVEDSYLARLLSISVLPKDLDKPNRPYTIEAEEALRKACSYNTTILKGHRSSVHSAYYSNDGKRIVSSSRDEDLLVWDTQSGALLKRIPLGDKGAVTAYFSPDGKQILTALWERSIIIINYETLQKEVLGHSNKEITCASFSPSGDRILSASVDNCFVIWDINTGNRILDGEGYRAAFSPDGRHVVSVSKNDNDRTNNIIIWNAWTGKKEATLPGHNNFVNSIAYSPNGKRILSASNDKTIKIWNVRTGELLQTIRNPKSRVLDAVFSPNSKYIVSASMDKKIRIWSIKTKKEENGKELSQLIGHSDFIHSVTFSHDGKYILSASRDKTVRIWEVPSCISNETSFQPETSAFINYNPTTKHYQTGIELKNNTIRLYNIDTREEIACLSGHEDRVVSASFNHNGKNIVSVSHYGTINVWDVKEETLIWSINSNSKRFKSICFSPDGKSIIATTFEGWMQAWVFLPLQTLIDQTNERFKNRQLTLDERRQYYLDITNHQQNKAQKEFWDTLQSSEYNKFVIKVLEKYYGPAFITNIHQQKYNVFCIPGKQSYDATSIKSYDCLCDNSSSKLSDFNIYEHESYVYNKWYAEYSNVLEGKVHHLNRPGYMLDETITDNEGHFERVRAHIGTYAENLFSSHVLEYELYQSYLHFSQKNINSPNVWEQLRASLTMRNMIHEGVGVPISKDFNERMLLSLLNGKGRDSLLSVQMLVIVKSSKSNQYELKIAQRSNTVAIKPGVFQFIPAGGFDILNDSDDDIYDDIELIENFSPGCAIFREYLEEIYNMPEFEGRGKGSIEERLMQDPHIKAIESMLAEKTADLHFLGSVIDLTTLRHELSFVLVIHKDLYSNEQIIANDEFKKGKVSNIPIRDFDKQQSIWEKIHAPSAALWQMFKKTSLYQSLIDTENHTNI